MLRFHVKNFESIKKKYNQCFFVLWPISQRTFTLTLILLGGECRMSLDLHKHYLSQCKNLTFYLSLINFFTAQFSHAHYCIVSTLRHSEHPLTLTSVHCLTFSFDLRVTRQHYSNVATHFCCTTSKQLCCSTVALNRRAARTHRATNAIV